MPAASDKGQSGLPQPNLAPFRTGRPDGAFPIRAPLALPYMTEHTV